MVKEVWHFAWTLRYLEVSNAFRGIFFEPLSRQRETHSRAGSLIINSFHIDLTMMYDSSKPWKFMGEELRKNIGPMRLCRLDLGNCYVPCQGNTPAWLSLRISQSSAPKDQIWGPLGIVAVRLSQISAVYLGASPQRYLLKAGHFSNTRKTTSFHMNSCS